MIIRIDEEIMEQLIYLIRCYYRDVKRSQHDSDRVSLKWDILEQGEVDRVRLFIGDYLEDYFRTSADLSAYMRPRIMKWLKRNKPEALI